MLGTFLQGEALSSVEGLRGLQLELLQRQLRRVCSNSPFYREKFREAGFDPSDVKSLDDVNKVPLTSREELELNYLDVLAVPSSDVATLRMSSGTSGHPLKVAHTKKDIGIIAEASARRLIYHGVTDSDVVQITSAYGLWQGAWSMHWGAEKVGACVLPVGPADTERQVLLIKQHGTTVLYAATNYHFRILEVAKTLGEDLSKFKLKMAYCVAEKPSSMQVARLKKEFGYAKVFNDYGATEFPGFSVNCTQDSSIHHVWADYYLIEVVNPETHKQLEEGERGELVITSLQREAFPLIRYLSRDVTTLFGYEKCGCGLSHPKIGADIDREDFMTKIRGVTVFPSHVEFLLSRFPELTGKCQIIVDKRNPQHSTILRVEVGSDLSQAKERVVKEQVIADIKNRVGVSMNEVVFIPPGQLEGKFRKVVVIT